MTHTIPKDITVHIDNGSNVIAIIEDDGVEKEKVWFYGIEGIEFKYNGDWADPHVVYDGYTLNYYDIEDRMCEYYNEENKDETFSFESFEKYMLLHKDLVFSELEDLICDGYYYK